jgi:hypothetical protein
LILCLALSLCTLEMHHSVLPSALIHFLWFLDHSTGIVDFQPGLSHARFARRPIRRQA